MTADGPIEQARSVLAEVTERLRAPNPHNIERALSLIGSSRDILRAASEDGAARTELNQTLRDLSLVAEQTAAFYLGLAAVVASRTGTYSRAGEPAMPSGCRSLSVDA